MKALHYIQSHTLDTPLNTLASAVRGTKSGYDGITEIWWESQEVLGEVFQTPEGQRLNLELRADEARFVDLANSSVFFTEEHTIFDFR
jgi:hypothetical protein